MRCPSLFWSISAILPVATLSAKEFTPAELLQLARDRAEQGDLSNADSTLSGLLNHRPGELALWEKVIRMQTQWGSLDEAFKSARLLNLRSQLGGGSAKPLPLLIEVEGRLERELDALLSLTSSESDYPAGLVERLKLTVTFNPEKSAKVVEHLFTLLRTGVPGDPKAGDAAAGFLVKLGEVPELCATVLRLAEAATLTSQRDWCEEYAVKMMGSRAWDRPGCLAQFLTCSPLTATVDQFLDLELPLRSEGTLLGVLAAELRNDYNIAWRWEALQTLKAQTSPRFGVGLLLHLIEGRADAESLRQFLQANQKDLASLTDRAASNVLAVLRSRHETLSRPLDPGLKALLAPLLAAEDWHLDSVRLEWRQAARIEEMKLTPAAARSLALATVRRLLVHDPVLARDYLTDAARLMRDSDGLNELLIETAREPELLATVLKLAGGTRLALDPGWERRFLILAWTNETLVRQPERLAMVLEATGLLGSPQEVLRWWEEGKGAEKGFLATVIKDVSNKSRRSTALVAALEKRPEATFGRDMVMAFLKPNVKEQLLLAARKHRVALEDLPADLKARMASFLTRWVGSEVLLANAVPGFAEVLKVSLTDRTTEVLAELARLGEVSRGEDLYPRAAAELALVNAVSGHPSEGMTGLAGILADAMMIDPGEARRVFRHVSSMVYAADRSAAERTADKRLGVFGLWLLAAMDHRKLHPLVQEELGKIVLQRADYFWVEKAEKRLLPPADFTEATRLVARLERAGVLAPGDEYQPVNLARYCTLLETLSRRLVEVPIPVRRETLKLLETRPERGFGAVVTIAFLQPTWQDADPGLAAVRPVLDYRPDEESLALRRALVKLFPEIEGSAEALSGNGTVAMLEKLHKKVTAREAQLSREPDKTPVVASTQTGRDETMAEMSRLMSRGEVSGVRQLFQGLINSAGPAQKTPPGEMVVWLCRERRRQRLLERCFENPLPPDVAGILLGSAALDESGQLGLVGTLLADDVAPALELAWVEAAGLVQPAVAAEEVLAAFARGMNGAPSYVAVPSLSRWLAALPAPARKEVLVWAAQVPPDKPWKELAIELQRAAVFVRTLKSKPAESELAAALEHYARCVQDEAVPYRIRLDLAVHLCRFDAAALPPAMVMTAAGLALQSWKNGDLNDDEGMVAVFEAFSHLPEDEAWRRLARGIIERRDQLIAEVGKGQKWGSPTANRVVLALLARLKDMPALLALTDDREGMTEDRQFEVAVLARYQEPRLAARVMRRDWKYLAGEPAVRFVPPTWSLRCPEREAAALSALFAQDVPDLALLGRAFLLRSARPVPGLAGADEVGWRAAAMKLAADIAATPRSGRGLRPRVNRFLVGLHPETLIPLADNLAADAAEEAWQVGASISEFDYADRAKVIATQDAIRVLDGDLDVMSAQMKRLGAIISSTTNYGAREAMDTQAVYLMQLVTTVAGNAHRLTLKQRGEWMIKLDRMLQGLGHTADGIRMSHALRGTSWIVDRWMEAQGLRDPQPWVIEDLSGGRTASLGAGLNVLAELAAESPGERTRELRGRLAIAVATTSELYLPAGERWKNLCDLILPSGIVTEEELVAISPELLVALRHSGKAALELAAVANEHGNTEMAARLLEMGLGDPQIFNEDTLPIGHFDAGERAATRRALIIRRASLLIAMNQGEGARQVLAMLAASPQDKGVSRLSQLASERGR